jgi:signal transduction histidine kinase
MQVMIQALLELSRVNTTGQPFETLDLREVVSEVVSDLEDRLTRSNGCVELGDLPIIDGDHVQVRQLLQNLIGNALKFARPDVPPVVMVTAEPVSQAGQDYCAVKVSDNGIGFEPQFSDVIFEPFKRLHGRGEYEGSGIGLAICKKIVERHQGSISTYSVPGEGSTFTVLFPCKPHLEDQQFHLN